MAGFERTVSAGIGLAYWGRGRGRNTRSATAETVLHEADAAMYRAKAAGKNRVVVSTLGPLTN